MTPSFRSKLPWLVGTPLVFVLGMATWGLISIPSSTEESETENSSINEDASTPLEDISTPSPEDSDSRDITSDGITTDNINDFGSCDDDARNYCSGFYLADWESYASENGYTTASWKYGLLDCLAAHRDQTSQACDDSLDRRQALNDAMNSACQIDRAEYCAGVTPSPGSEPQVDCLKDHYEELSADCAEALDAHEAAKPSNK